MSECDEPDVHPRSAGVVNVGVPLEAGPSSTVETADPMFDVHLPQGAAHTWKDFWIHLGTISIGLLIAIGLEQSVEAVHRLHQRHQLEEDLQTEPQQNLALMVKDNEYFDATRPWLIQLRGKVAELRKSGGKAKVDYSPVPNKGAMDWPEAPSWNVAKASAQLALLPRDEARMYDFVYSEQGVLKERVYAYGDSLDAIRRFESRFVNLTSAEPYADKTNTEQQMGDLAVGSIYHDTPIPDLSEMTS
jgi:hypothetical protein